LVPPRDAAALADAIEKFAGNPALARAMGERGAERARANFSLRRMAAENEACYHSLLSKAAENSATSNSKDYLSVTI
jgi:glycosyltransferase involved in cell wall biosynthesis